MRLSLQQRLLAGIGVVLSLVTLLSAGLDAGRAQQERRQALETRLQLVAAMQARTLAQAVWDYNSAQIQAVLDSLSEDPDFAFAEILDDKDKPIAKRETTDPRQREARQLSADQPIDYLDGAVKKTIGRLRYSLSELRLEQANRTQLQLNAASALLILAVTLAAVYVVFRTINGPLVAMTAAMTTLARGDQSIVVPALHRRDEIGDMARAVVVFKDNALAMARMDAERKEADQSNEAKRRTGLAKVADELDGTIGTIAAKLQSAAGDMEQGVTVLGTTAREADVASAAVTQASREASANVQNIADAATQWSTSIGEVASQSERSVQIAQRASDDAMRATKAIGGMTEAAQRIGDAVDLIAAISAQTNLLALNATIEAARAGEAGRGFTVVATEVKALAARTNGAVESISQQVAAITSVSSTAAAEVMTIAKVIGEMTGLSAAVASSIEKQTAATAEIARSADAAAERVAELERSLAVLTGAAVRTHKACDGFEGSAAIVADGVRRLASEAAEFGRRIRAG